MSSRLILARSAAVGLALCAAALRSTGCAAGSVAPSPGAAAPSAEIVDADLTAEAVTGQGPTGWPGVDFPIPAGARSVAIEFACEGDGFYTMELGDSMALGQASLSGSCEDHGVMSWPVTPRTDQSLSVTVDEGVAWTATPRFSAAEFAADAAVTADCAAFTDVYSALVNADTGFVNYAAFDEAKWAARVQTGSAQLSALAASSTSSLAAPLTAMADVVATASEPGNALRGAEEPLAQVGSVCNENQTPYFIKAEFGG